MAFHVRTDSLNHSPQWYESRRLDEDSPPSLRAFINADLRLMDRDDTTMTPGEKLGIYTEAWNEIESGKKGNVDLADLQEVIEREGFTPQSQYSQGPFLAISRIMEKHGLSTTVVRQFVAWKAKNANATKARLAKVPKESRSAKAARLKKEQADRIFGKGKWTPSAGVDF